MSETVVAILKQKLTDAQIAKWMTAPNAWVGDWRCPVDIIATEPDRVIAAAQHEIGATYL